ncbi:hypothetical protein [Mahella australiensis]|uniref:Uncharacterized protein n=1 Tax=Mahella australiensis (strain DSM 15567 / CIP 107919 / 50-1 BON) TaxID=697281 RepID=F4A218_MAHA5|nr:hypothetical protein [Mahella australiensis]AEE97157.1 hypothetical protein Mahau_1981 [Mahella australiensis 50-1 BON]
MVREWIKKAPFPAIMSIISLAWFIVAYLLVTVRSIEPYYLEGLIFAIPFVLFAVTTFFTVKGKLKIGVSSIITGILIFVLGFVQLSAFAYISFDAVTTATTDTDKYQRILKLTDYPNNPLTEEFPNKIPGNAKNVTFIYNPAFLQGSEIFGLKFQTDPDSIQNYINEFSEIARWIGDPEDSEAEKNGIISGPFDVLEYENLPENFTIYLIDSKPYQLNDWNHGELSLVAISKQRNEIIFLAEDW